MAQERTGQGEADELDSVDYGLGYMSGKALAVMLGVQLSDELVIAEGIECFECLKVGVSGVALIQILNRSLFLRGHLDAFHHVREGIA